MKGTPRGRNKARFFRPGTAYLDEVAAEIVAGLGLTPAGFNINGDGRATYPGTTLARETGNARTGDIILCHGNHPGSGTSERIAVPWTLSPQTAPCSCLSPRTARS